MSRWAWLWLAGIASGIAVHGIGLWGMARLGVMERLLSPHLDPLLLLWAAGFLSIRLIVILGVPGLVAGGLCWWGWGWIVRSRRVAP